MSLCIIAAGKTTVLAAAVFTLSWTHSIERVAWQEDWQVTEQGLEIREARIKGSGAGMEPPEDSVFEGGWWHYKPNVPPMPELRLATSGAAGSWRLCTPRTCLTIGGKADARGATVARCSAAGEEASAEAEQGGTPAASR